MAKVVIGGEEYEIPELSLYALERSWPLIQEAMLSLDPMKGPSAGVGIVAAGLIDAPNFDPKKFGIQENESLGEDQLQERVTRFLKKKVKAKEIENVRKCVHDICEEAGLEPASGEPLSPPEVEVENLSMETAPVSLPNSSPPDVKGEAGTE